MFSSKSQLQSLLSSAIAAAGLPPAQATLERPKQAAHGDYATNVAMQVAKAAKLNPRAAAERLLAALPANALIERAEIAGPGFINFYLTPAARFAVIDEAFSAAYGTNASGANERVMVEFVSANPTGPLHVGHGRGAAVGDALASVLEANGYEAYREFYYNDAGEQINNLVTSVQARIAQVRVPDAPFPEKGYRGEYIVDLARAYIEAHPSDGEGHDVEAVRRFAIAALRAEQDKDLAAFRVRFDNFFLESSLYTEGKVEAAVAALIANGKTYEQDGALWLRTTEYGDDKDRVMRKSEGGYTYFVPDVAYHLNKFQRGFTRVVNEQGADHHSTVTRVRAGLQALGLGVPAGYPDYVLHQMVLVLRDGAEVKFSKRAGDYVTLRDLIDEVGADAVRFFLLMRKHDSQLTFDIDLAKSKSEENPVYYVQYAHARICTALAKAQGSGYALPVTDTAIDAALLVSPHADALARKIADYPDVVRAAAAELSPHLVPFYLRELAACFHAYYNADKFLIDDAPLRTARLKLVAATGCVLKQGLTLIGVSAPESM